VILPADQVADIGGDRLVGHDVLRRQRKRAQQQEHERHRAEDRPELVEELVRLARRDERDDAAHEHRDQRIEHRHAEAGDEQPDEQALGLAGKMPIEADQPGGWLWLLGHGGRLQEPFEHSKHDTLAKTTARHGRHRLRRRAARTRSIYRNGRSG
jgi:hypothetical protein